MATASTVAVSVRAARLTIALVINAMNLTPVLASIRGHLVASELFVKVVTVTNIVILVNKGTIVDLGGDCTRTEGTLNQSLALHVAFFSHLTAA